MRMVCSRPHSRVPAAQVQVPCQMMLHHGGSFLIVHLHRVQMVSQRATLHSLNMACCMLTVLVCVSARRKSATPCHHWGFIVVPRKVTQCISTFVRCV